AACKTEEERVAVGKFFHETAQMKLQQKLTNNSQEQIPKASAIIQIIADIQREEMISKDKLLKQLFTVLVEKNPKHFETIKSKIPKILIDGKDSKVSDEGVANSMINFIISDYTKEEDRNAIVVLLDTMVKIKLQQQQT